MASGSDHARRARLQALFRPRPRLSDISPETARLMSRGPGQESQAGSPPSLNGSGQGLQTGSRPSPTPSGSNRGPQTGSQAFPRRSDQGPSTGSRLPPELYKQGTRKAFRPHPGVPNRGPRNESRLPFASPERPFVPGVPRPQFKRKTDGATERPEKRAKKTSPSDLDTLLTTVADDSTHSHVLHTASSMTGHSPFTSRTDVLASRQPQLTFPSTNHANDPQPGNTGDAAVNGAPSSFQLPVRTKVNHRRALEKAVQERDSQAELVKWLEKQLVEGKAELARRQHLVDAHTGSTE